MFCAKEPFGEEPSTIGIPERSYHSVATLIFWLQTDCHWRLLVSFQVVLLCKGTEEHCFPSHMGVTEFQHKTVDVTNLPQASTGNCRKPFCTLTLLHLSEFRVFLQSASTCKTPSFMTNFKDLYKVLDFSPGLQNSTSHRKLPNRKCGGWGQKNFVQFCVVF